MIPDRVLPAFTGGWENSCCSGVALGQREGIVRKPREGQVKIATFGREESKEVLGTGHIGTPI